MFHLEERSAALAGCSRDPGSAVLLKGRRRNNPRLLRTVIKNQKDWSSNLGFKREKEIKTGLGLAGCRLCFYRHFLMSPSINSTQLCSTSLFWEAIPAFLQCKEKFWKPRCSCSRLSFVAVTIAGLATSPAPRQAVVISVTIHLGLRGEAADGFWASTCRQPPGNVWKAHLICW